MSERFCINCRHYLLDSPDADPVCARSSKAADIVTASLAEWFVTGKGLRPEQPNHYRCSVERGFEAPNTCGPGAKFYVERGAA